MERNTLHTAAATFVFWLVLLLLTNNAKCNETNLPPQSPLFFDGCFVSQALTIPIQHGFITVHCVLTEHQFQTTVFQQIFNSDARVHISHIVGVWRRTVEFLNRDGKALICAIQCSQGKPYPRLDLSSQYEPAQVNVGCADVASLRCEDACPNSIHNVPNGYVTCTEDVFVGSTCTLECDDGFTQTGPASKTCSRSSAAWTPQEDFACKKPPSCPSLPQVFNGDIRCSMGNKVLSRCTLYCNEGYHQESGINSVWCFHLELDKEPDWVWVDKYQVSKSLGNISFSCKAIFPSNEEHTTLSLEGSELSLKRYSVCSTSPFRRQRCGTSRTNRNSCRDMRCCWEYDARKSRQFNCYKPVFQSQLAGVSKMSKSAPREKQMTSSKDGGGRFGTTRFAEKSADEHSYNGAGPTHVEGLDEAYESVYPLPVATGQCACDLEDAKPRSDPSGRITGGASVNIREYPWQGLVYFNNHMCGASLITDQYAVTAAHCLRPTDGSMDAHLGNYVFFGVTNLTSDEQNPQMQRLTIEKIIRHPEFTERSQGYAMNDLAILKFSKTVNIKGKTVTPICLPGKRTIAEFQDCRVSGYGKDGTNEVQKYNLHAANVDVITRETCENYYPKYTLKGNETLCAGSKPNHSADTCEGDSGGPLACRSSDNDNCSWHLVGITSFGREPCGKAPSVYVNVASYEAWIRETIYKLHNHIHNPETTTGP